MATRINPQEAFSNPTPKNPESSVVHADEAPISGENGLIAQEVTETATPPVISQPPVSVGVGPEDVPTPASENVPLTLGGVAAEDTENPSVVAQEVSAQQTPDIPVPQENPEMPAKPSTPPPDESSSPAESVPSPEATIDGKSLDGVGAPQTNISPHKMEPHDLEATVGTDTNDSDQSLSSEPTPPPVPEDSNIASPPPETAQPEMPAVPSSASLDQSTPSAPIPERITPEEQAPEAEKGEELISILDRIEKRNNEQANDINELKRRMQSPETATNREAA